MKADHHFQLLKRAVFALCFSVLLSFPALALAGTPPECQWASSWLAWISTPPSANTHVTDRYAWDVREWNERERATAMLFHSYREHQKMPAHWALCLKGTAYEQEALYSVNAAFYEGALQTIRVWSLISPRLSEWLKLYDVQFKDQAPAFRMVGHSSHLDDSPTSLAGGFHRATGSIFLDIDTMKFDEWMLVFIHEVTHALDVQLGPAMETYSNPALVKNVAEISHLVPRAADLSTEQNRVVRKWLHAGLDRGLLFEVRAWSVSFAIYEEGSRMGLWNSIGWMNQVLRERKPREDLVSFTYRYLNAHSPNPPAEGIYSLPLVREMLEKMRAEFLVGNPPVGQ